MTVEVYRYKEVEVYRYKEVEFEIWKTRKGYELATGTELDKDLKTYLIIDILVDSGVLATVLL